MDAGTAKGTKNIVILGGGFGGIACALTLEKLMRNKTSLLEEFNLFLIDKKNYHLYAPFLYEVATTSPEDGSLLDFKKIIAIPIPEIINGKKIEFNRGKIVDIDPKGKNVYLEGSAPLPYEYLVLALGAEPAYFGIPGVRDHAHSLKWLDDAIHIRDAIRKKFDQKKPGETLSILIAGGGTTGVEVASELVGYIKKLNRKTNQNIRSDITLIEGASTVLPGFDDWVVKKSTKRLRMIGIRLELGRMVSRLDDQIAYIKQSDFSNRPPVHTEGPKEIQRSYDVFIWSGGVQASSVFHKDEVAQDERGRIEVNPFLKCIGPDPNSDIQKTLFAIGDNACFYNPKTGHPEPGTAPLAIGQGKAAAKNIYRDLVGKPGIPYNLKKHPFVITLGGKCAIAQIGPFRLFGLSAWVLKHLIELHHFLYIHPGPSALRRWWRGLRIFSRND